MVVQNFSDLVQGEHKELGLNEER